uniref:Resistance to inhibitors of cholinesterase 3 variant 2 n=1 Tax=Locusta migratoria manilensis TaxID=229990 RepID=A0A1Y0F4E3_LOCMI|nr:resistance to inhibitors of cholinesterase 3 variant 2 [Locusta migratoria manilensis]
MGILAIVVGCFAVLWPKLFYPMLQSSISNRAPLDHSQACCDVIFETDVNAIKIMTEMCGNILHHHSELDPKINVAFLQGKWSKEMVNTCRSDVLEKCGVDITAFLNEKVRLGHSYKQMLDGIRSFNISVCLKTNFGVPPSLIGAPRRMRILSATRPIRQERPPHLRPDMLHPALRERGRAIPQSHIVPRIVEKEGRPGPIPGMRPPMGGAGHVVPAPKTGGTMGIIMPMYTIGIVIFFMYTIMKVMFKKPSDHSSSYGEFHPDPEFRKIVFAEDYTTKNGNCEDKLRPRIKNEPASTWKAPEENGTRLVMTAITGLIAEVDLQREILEKRAGTQNSSLSEKKTVEDIPEVNNVAASTYLKNEKLDTATIDKSDTSKESFQVNVQEETEHHKTEEKVDTYQPTPAVEAVTSELQEESAGTKPKQKVEFSADTDNQSQHLQQQGQVVVVGMDVTASCEGGGRWSRPVTPVPPQDFGVLPTTVSRSRSATPGPIETETRSIMLEGHLPSHSQLLVSDSETHAEPTGAPGSAGADPPVVLSGKVTLSLISLQEALAAEEEQEQQKHSEQQQDQ